jgi:chromosome segregation ATPase
VNNHFDISWLWTTLGTLGGGFVTWLFGRRKQKAETKSSELENVEKALEIYRKILEDNSQQILSLKTEVNKLENKLDTLTEENRLLKKRISELENHHP